MGVSGAPPLDVNAELVAARRELISVLEDLEARDWDKGTLCQGWRVRDVASHVALAPSVGVGRIIGGMVKARGNADRMIDAQARAAGEREPSEILRHLYRMAEDTRVPAGASAEKLLADTVIHSLDITHPNGWDLDLPADRVRFVLSTLVKLGGRYKGRDRAEGLHFDTTDIDWRCGCGDHVRGPANVVLLALAGRPVCHELTGDGVAELAAR